MDGDFPCFDTTEDPVVYRRDFGRAVAAALGDLLAAAEAAGRIAEARYHVVVVPDGGAVRIESVPSRDEAAALLRGLEGADVRAFCFYGRRCPTTRPPARYLLTHEGRVPLFDADVCDEIDPTGSMARPGTIVLPLPAEPPPPEDDTDDDQGDEDDDEGGDDL
jgi:hypothetical protein